MNTQTNAIQDLSAQVQQSHETHFVRSADGTRIGYLQIGRGRGLVLVQGAMGLARSFTQLGSLLADSFTVYIPDRRGRGLSGPGGYGIQKEVEDLDALLSFTGTSQVFGLSSGALITLAALLRLPTIRKAAIYEPPLFTQGLPTELMARYEKEIVEGKLAAAMITAMKATQMGPAFMNFMPRLLLEALTSRMMDSQDRSAGPGEVTMRMLAPTVNSDLQVVAEMNGKLESIRTIKADLLLLGGSASPKYLQADMDALARTLPNARRVILPGLGHSAAWNYDKQTNPQGQPEPVAQELRRFFAQR